VRCLASPASLALGMDLPAVLQMEPRIAWRSEIFRIAHTSATVSKHSSATPRRHIKLSFLSGPFGSYPASSVRPYNCRPGPHGCVKDISISNSRACVGIRLPCWLGLFPSVTMPFALRQTTAQPVFRLFSYNTSSGRRRSLMKSAGPVGSACRPLRCKRGEFMTANVKRVTSLLRRLILCFLAND